jgi:hypothetical protein
MDTGSSGALVHPRFCWWKFESNSDSSFRKLQKTLALGAWYLAAQLNYA